MLFFSILISVFSFSLSLSLSIIRSLLFSFSKKKRNSIWFDSINREAIIIIMVGGQQTGTIGQKYTYQCKHLNGEIPKWVSLYTTHLWANINAQQMISLIVYECDTNERKKRVSFNMKFYNE